MSDHETALLEPHSEPQPTEEHDFASAAAEPDGRPSPAPVRQPLHLGAWDAAALTVTFALAAGLIESAYWGVRWVLGPDELICLSRDLFWMIPVAQLGVFAVPGVLLALAFRRWPGSRTFSAAVGLLATLAWLNLLALGPALLPLAHVLLAAGLGVATARIAGRNPRRFLHIARYAAVGLGLVAFGLTAAMLGGRTVRECRQAAAIPDAPAGSPNVLLIVMDTVRADAVELDGPAGNTPRLRELADEGVAFTLAHAPSSWTLPSHASMFTGRPPGELAADWLAPLDGRYPTLAEVLRSRGYATAGFVGNTRYCGTQTGLARGFGHYEDYGHAPVDFLYATSLGRRVLLSQWMPRFGWYDWPGRKSAERVGADFLDWLSRRPAGRDRPYFAFLNYWDAHDPYFAPAPFDEHPPRSHHEGLVLRHWWWLDKLDAEPGEADYARAAYDDCIGYLDAQIGRLLDELDRRGELENTIVIVTSDHGEHFGEHGLFLHGNSLYEPVVHVPLVISAPGRVPAGERVDEAATLQDLAATVLDHVGAGQDHPLPGRSLARLWNVSEDARADASPAEPVSSDIASPAKAPPDHGRSPVSHGPVRAVVLGRMKYIRTGEDTEELYDLEADPQEEHNLIGRPRHRDVLRRCREALSR